MEQLRIKENLIQLHFKALLGVSGESWKPGCIDGLQWTDWPPWELGFPLTQTSKHTSPHQHLPRLFHNNKSLHASSTKCPTSPLSLLFLSNQYIKLLLKSFHMQDMTFLKVPYRGRNYPESQVNLLVPLSARRATPYKGIREYLPWPAPALLHLSPVMDPSGHLWPMPWPNPPAAPCDFTASTPESPNWEAKPWVPHTRASTKMGSGNHQCLQFHLCESQWGPCRSCHCATRKATCGTARCWEVFAAQQQLGVRRNQYILQWRETEPSSGPVPSWHRGIWNMGQEQSALLITVCFVKWKMCNIGFTSWIPNCLAIFPSTFQIYWSVRAWLSLLCSSDWHITRSWRLTSSISAVSEDRVSSCLSTHCPSSTSTCASTGQLIPAEPSIISLLLFCFAGDFSPTLLLPKTSWLHHSD